MIRHLCFVLSIVILVPFAVGCIAGVYVVPKVVSSIHAVSNAILSPPALDISFRHFDVPCADESSRNVLPPPSKFLDHHGKHWQIVMLPPAIMPQGPDTLGWTVEEKSIVYVNNSQTLADTQETVIHELGHVVLGTENSSERVTVHEIIYEESPRLQIIFANNPELMKWLQQPTKEK